MTDTDKVIPTLARAAINKASVIQEAYSNYVLMN